MTTDRTLAERYRKRAAELRALGVGLLDETARKLLLETAAEYDKLAQSGNVLDQANRSHTNA